MDLSTPWPLWVTCCLIAGAGLYTLAVFLLGYRLAKQSGEAQLRSYIEGGENDGGCFVKQQSISDTPDK